MKKTLALGLGLAAAALGGLATHTRVAQAGANIAATVSVVLDVGGQSGTASGAMGVARNTGDSVQYIACEIDSTATVTCAAQQASPVVRAVQCKLTRSDQLQWVPMQLNPDSFIKFKWRTVSGNNVCTLIRVENDSRYAPKRFP